VPTLHLLAVILTTHAFAADDDLKLPPGFRGELLYSVPREKQGSWVSMTHDPKGRLIASDQYGPLYGITPGDSAATTKVEKLNLALGHAHGLCYAKNSLFAVVNGPLPDGRPAGVYRAISHDHGDTYDAPQLLLTLKDRNGNVAAGEHGPHGIRVAPDGTLYLIAGNFTQIPEHLLPDSPAKNWNEELLLPRMTDHLDATTMAPGGWVATSSDDGKTWRLLCTGLRNSYDLDFTDDGEAITFDSDMEWDVGAPWYRPTRITHLVSGGEYGWRNGSAKWREDYPDSLPAVLNVGLASPTGVTFGRGLKFPAKWQHAFFMADWAYGRIFAATLSPRGSSYGATVEVFASKRPSGHGPCGEHRRRALRRYRRPRRAVGSVAVHVFGSRRNAKSAAEFRSYVAKATGSVSWSHRSESRGFRLAAFVRGRPIHPLRRARGD
jgi:hypothetical protein